MKIKKSLSYFGLTGVIASTAFGEDIDLLELLATANAGNGNVNGVQSGVDYDGAGPDPAGTLRLTADNDYLLNGSVFVEDGATLIIEPGTTTYATLTQRGIGLSGELEDGVEDGDPTNDVFGALVVSRGGRIEAEGTAQDPIVFTALAERDGLFGAGNILPVAGRDHGLWGGVALLGRAPVTLFNSGTNTGNGRLEGFGSGSDDRLLYGVDLAGGETFDPEDNSGVMRYVSIRFGGFEFADGDEVNGLTLGGVGRGTTLDHIEVISNNDDGFEWFGGTVNSTRLAAIFCDDDSFDFDQGFQGTIQFAFAIQTEGSLGAGDKLGEHDGRDDSAEDFDPHPQVATKPVVFNATYIGSRSGENPVGRAFTLREDFAGQYHNSFFMDAATGLQIGASSGDGGPLTAENVANNELRFENISWFNVPVKTANVGNTTTARNGTLTIADAATQLFDGDYDGTLDDNGSNSTVAELPIGSVSRAAGSGSLDPTLPADSPLFSDNGAGLTSLPIAYDLPGDADNLDTSDLATVDYRGAFGSENWLAGWSYLAENGFFSGTSTGGGNPDDQDSDGVIDALETAIGNGLDPANANTSAQLVQAFDNFVADQRAEATTVAEGNFVTLGGTEATIDQDSGNAIINFSLMSSDGLTDFGTNVGTFSVPIGQGRRFFRFEPTPSTD